jgi:hypothetical protein
METFTDLLLFSLEEMDMKTRIRVESYLKALPDVISWGCK